MGLMMENSNIMGGHWKIQFSGRGGSPKKQYIGGNCLKKVAWTVCRFKRVGQQRRGDGVFEGQF